jgi:hypothetical protein
MSFKWKNWFESMLKTSLSTCMIVHLPKKKSPEYSLVIVFSWKILSMFESNLVTGKTVAIPIIFLEYIYSIFFCKLECFSVKGAVSILRKDFTPIRIFSNKFITCHWVMRHSLCRSHSLKNISLQHDIWLIIKKVGCFASCSNMLLEFS